MNAKTEIPDTILRAFSLLESIEGVTIIEQLSASDKDERPGFAFVCEVPAPSGNTEGIPDIVQLRVVVPNSFPYSAVQVCPLHEEVRGFPHQDAQSGKLCLPPEYEAPWDISRLKQYVLWAIDWIADAANGELLKPGDPFEVPDFSSGTTEPPTDDIFVFDESPDSFCYWKDQVGSTGKVHLTTAKLSNSYFPIKYWDAHQKEIRTTDLYSETYDRNDTFVGSWVLLDNLSFFRHRPPQTYTELSILCKKAGANLDEAIRYAWKQGKGSVRFGVTLIGFPVPEKVGGSPVEVHWQPILFDNMKLDRKRYKPKHGAMKKGAVWATTVQKGTFAPDKRLVWGDSENISRRRLYARGSFASIRSTHISVAGCGAVGSVVAELLARGGASPIKLFDPDRFEFGNQCRHTLDGREVRKGKASGLARRLSSANLLSDITGYQTHLPPNDPKDLETTIDLLESSDLIIDCTTDHGAFLWLNKVARGSMTRLASLFFDFNATVLTLCISGKNTSCNNVAKRLYEDIKKGMTPIEWDYYKRIPAKDEQVIPGAGCWHPTFPAVNSHIWMLVASAVDVLQEILSQPLTCDGTAVLIQRKDASSSQVGPLVEVVWRERYR